MTSRLPESSSVISRRFRHFPIPVVPCIESIADFKVRGALGLMANIEPAVAVLERYLDTAPFVQPALAAADSERNALGFLPGKAFEEFARKEQLLVAVAVGGSGMLYAGHLLYDARQPKATVLQLHVSAGMRRLGIGRALLTRLKKILTEHTFISIYAAVADDLIEANNFWEQQGFYVQRSRPGGRARGRTILVRCHELDSPQLFPRSGISAGNPLGLGGAVDRHIYLLDLNILFDLGPRRHRNEMTLDLFRAERHGACELALSSELREELVRTAKTAPRSDPMHSWATTFITFPIPPPSEQASLLNTLRAIVFPGSGNNDIHSANDSSDLNHLATAIYHRLGGFITNDGRILQAASPLNERYGIRVISPLAFREAAQAEQLEEAFETQTAGSLSLTTVVEGDEPAVRRLLLQIGVPDTEVLTRWAALDSNKRACARWAAWSNTELVGFLACLPNVPGTQATARLAVDETNVLARGAASVLLTRLLSHLGDDAPISIRLELPPHQATLRELAASLGFVRSDDGRVLSKIILNRILTAEHWSNCRHELWTACGLRLPLSPPPIRDIHDRIELIRADGNRIFVPLFSLESYLAPALFCLPGRRAVITPIQRRFAERLLEHSRQGSLLPRARAGLFAEKHYVSAQRTLKLFQHGTVILFYESSKNHGCSAIIAAARVQRAYLKPADALDRADLDPSVLDDQTLMAIGSSKSRTVTAFDNVMSIPNAVPLAKLHEFGCGNASQLISTRAISAEQLRQILLHGLSNG